MNTYYCLYVIQKLKFNYKIILDDIKDKSCYFKYNKYTISKIITVSNTLKYLYYNLTKF